ncbi:MAG: hypothetical protein ACTSYB_13575 [Candidatus Helarchaeota archaeon]
MVPSARSSEERITSQILIQVKVPIKNFSTWQSAILFSLIQISFEPSELDEFHLQQPSILCKVRIPVDFLTLSKLELDLNLTNADQKQLKRALIRHFQQCNAKVRSIEIPPILWKKSEK